MSERTFSVEQSAKTVCGLGLVATSLHLASDAALCRLTSRDVGVHFLFVDWYYNVKMLVVLAQLSPHPHVSGSYAKWSREQAVTTSLWGIRRTPPSVA